MNASGAILFDGLAQPIPLFVYAVIGGAIALLAGCLFWKLSGRTVKWYVPLAIMLIGGFGGVMPVWDYARVHRIAASTNGLTVTRGTVTQVWHIAKRTRDFSSGSHRYKTTVSEGFDVGEQRFSWKVGSCLSNAALCNLAITAEPIKEGMQVEVHWFEDEAQGNEHRVVMLNEL